MSFFNYISQHFYSDQKVKEISATVASKIIVPENGVVIEEDNHQELMHSGGHYYKLFSSQASRYISSDQISNS